MARRWLFLLFVTIIGFVWPFIPVLVIIEFFYLLIPLTGIFIVSCLYLGVLLIRKDISKRWALFIFLIIPTFIGAQIFSGFLINSLQKYRSTTAIEIIEKNVTLSGAYPDSFNVGYGINYERINEKRYIVSYSRGFMVTEKYDSHYKSWTSYGWND